jgi:hypothetical protein
VKSISKNSIYLFGHSTEIASSYMNTGSERNRISALILNSPLDFYQSELRSSSVIGVQNHFYYSPYAKIDGALPHVYTQSINKDFYGEWD